RGRGRTCRAPLPFALPSPPPPLPFAAGAMKDLRQNGGLTPMLHFELVTPARLVRSEDVHMVVVPGTEGEFGVLEGHAPLMATVRDGSIKIYRTPGTEFETIEVRGGFAEVSANGLTVLAEHVEG